ncbi:hypothetical protein LA52FAK_44170 [Desulforhopalus sp. 52FAK]
MVSLERILYLSEDSSLSRPEPHTLQGWNGLGEHGQLIVFSLMKKKKKTTYFLVNRVEDT